MNLPPLMPSLVRRYLLTPRPRAVLLAVALLLLTAALRLYPATPRPWLIPTPVKPVALGSLEWGDFDGDGDLDLAVTGQAAFSNGATTFLNAITRVYRTDDSTFDYQVGENVFTLTTKVLRNVNLNNTLIPPLRQGDGTWGDYDGDGDLDLLLMGISERITVSGKENRPVVNLVRNDEGVFRMSSFEPTVGVYDGDAAWGDYDGDGDLDFVVSGATALTAPFAPVTHLYQNQGGTFVRLDAGLPGLRHSAVAWADADGDGDLDLTLSGATDNGHFMADVFRNDGGAFNPMQAGLPGLAFGSLEWGDYDGDGDPDLLASGGALDPALLRGTVRLYRNDGTGRLTDTGLDLGDVMTGAARWGDWDGDSDLDLVLLGKTRPLGTASLRLLENTGTGFVEASALRGFSGLTFSDARFGDYNGDGDLDLIVTGRQGSAEDLNLRFFMNRRVPECTAPDWVPEGESLTCF